MTKGNRLCDIELDQLQKLKEENKKLKKQIGSLRKQLSRIDLDRYENLKELIDKQRHEDEASAKTSKLLKKWKCYECGNGILKLLIFNRRDGTFYYRRCSNCDHRTRLQKYHKDVEGVKWNTK